LAHCESVNDRISVAGGNRMIANQPSFAPLSKEV
jgi:hypothetical protein